MPGKAVDVVITTDDTLKLKASMRSATHAVVAKTVFDIEAGIKNRLAQPGGGKIYGATGPTRPGKRGSRKRHQASAPGQPPATDTGTLANSTQGKMLTETEGEVRVTAEYGRLLEDGTVFIEPRPFFAPSVEEVRPGYNDAMKTIARGTR
jgi:hypothetical protein